MATGSSLTESTFTSALRNMTVLRLDCIANTDGTFTKPDGSSYTTGKAKGMYLLAVKTFPTWNDEGNPMRAPAANYDITLTDEDKLAVPGFTLSNRSASAAENVYPTQVTPAIDGEITVAIANMVNDRARVTLKLYLCKHPTAIVAAA